MKGKKNDKPEFSGLGVFRPAEEDDVYAFDIWLCHDAMPYVETVKSRAQFFFSVSNLPDAVPLKRRILRFRVRNMSTQSKLLGYGHKPVVVELANKDYQDCVKGR